MDWKILLGIVVIINATTARPQTSYNPENDETQQFKNNENGPPTYQVTENVIDIPDDRPIPGPIIANHSLITPLNIGNNNNNINTASNIANKDVSLEDNASWNTGAKHDRGSHCNGNNNKAFNIKGNGLGGNKPREVGNGKDDTYDRNDGIAIVNNGNWNSGNTPDINVVVNEAKDERSKVNDISIIHIKSQHDDNDEVTDNKKCTLFKCIKNYFSGVKKGVVRGFRTLFGHKDEFKSIEDEADKQFELIDELHKEIADDDDLREEFNF